MIDMLKCTAQTDCPTLLADVVKKMMAKSGVQDTNMPIPNLEGAACYNMKMTKGAENLTTEQKDMMFKLTSSMGMDVIHGTNSCALQSAFTANPMMKSAGG